MKKQKLSRRKVITLAGAAGAALTLNSLISPEVRAASSLLGFFTSDSKTDKETLKKFVDTITPGVKLDKTSIEHFYDKRFPFRRWRRMFIRRLNRHAKKEFEKKFHQLSRDERTLLVEKGLKGGKINRQLYHGALFLTQVAVYCGIYTPEDGALLINFEGAMKEKPKKDKWHHAHLSDLSYKTLTVDGNYH